MFVLDTDTCIYAIERRSRSVIARIARTHRRDLAISSITVAELRAGAAFSRRRAETLRALETFFLPLTSLEFGNQAAIHYAAIQPFLMRRGMLIGPYDLLIAATALAHDATLVTNNVGEFARVPGLKLENWLEGA